MPEHSVRPANQNAPVSEGVFATVLVSNVDGQGWDDYNLKDTAPIIPTLPVTNMVETIIGQRTFTCSIQFFREGAMTYAASLKSLFLSASVQEKLQLLGIGFVSCSQVRDLSTVQSTFWEERSQVNVVFHVIAKFTNDMPIYTTFPIEISTEEQTMTTEVTVL